jgi:capsular exopolysaccharide synthesis family protein
MDADPHNSAPGPLGNSIHVKLYRLRALARRYWWVLLLSIAVGVGYQGWVVYKKPTLYSSYSEVVIRDEVQTDATRRYADQGAFVGNTLKMIQGPNVAEGARNRLALRNELIEGRASITATVAPKTTIFNIVGTGTDPEYTRRFLDAAVEEFLAQYKELRQSSVNDAQGEFATTLKGVQARLAEENAKLSAFVKAHNMEFWIHQRDEAVNFLNELRQRQNALSAELRRLENLTPDQLLSTATASGAPAGKTTAPGADGPQESVFSGELVTSYMSNMQDLTKLQARIDERSRVWKPKHPMMQNLQREADVINRTLDGIRQQAVGLSKARIAAINAELKALDLSIQDWTEKAKQAREKDGEFKQLEDAVKRLRDQEDKLLSNVDAIGLTADQSYLKILNKASPAQPVPKGTARHLIIGLVGGLVVGSIILYLLDRSDDRLASPSELLNHFAEPILGQIPDVRASRTAHGLPLLQPEDDRYTYAEAFRSLRSSLIFMPNQAEMKAILVTSAIPNEGKSTIASNLAITMANAGARVLLVDADLRRGDIATLFDIDGKNGLTNILRGEVPWRECVEDTKLASLHVIARGPVTNQSGELLLRPIVDTVLDEMKASYDLVIFNTAPILAADDTPTLAPHFDGVLMVIRAQFTGAKLTQNALNALYQRQVNVLGLILNAVDTETPDYYYYRYPKYYAA